MTSKRLPGDAPCPCGSGKTYGDCCGGKGFEWRVDDEGEVFRSVPISEELADLLRQANESPEGTQSGAARPDNLLFADLGPLEHVEHDMVEAMKKIGVDPALIYAFEKTGLIVSEENQHLIPDVQMREWEAAVEEYRATMEAVVPPAEPVGTVALYGPDDKKTTKIVAGVVRHDGAEPILKRWVGTNLRESAKFQKELREFFRRHGVHRVVTSDGNMGCPHEEGEDFPEGEDCPFCPFWRGKQGSNREDLF